MATWVVTATRRLSGNPFSSFDWSCSVVTRSRRFQGPYFQIATTGVLKGHVDIGNKLDGQFHGTVFKRFAGGNKLITQFVNGERHGAGARIAPDGRLWLFSYENDVLKSCTKGWCRNCTCTNVYIRVHTVQHTFWM